MPSPGTTRRTRYPGKRPAQRAGTGRTRRRPARREVEPMPGWYEETRGTRAPIGTGMTHGTRAAHGKRGGPSTRSGIGAGRELLTPGRAAVADRGGSGPAASPRRRAVGAACGGAMWHCPQTGPRRPGPLGRRNTGVLSSSRRAPTAKGGKGNFTPLRGDAKLPLPPQEPEAPGAAGTPGLRGDCLAGVLPAEALCGVRQALRSPAGQAHSACPLLAWPGLPQGSPHQAGAGRWLKNHLSQPLSAGPAGG